MAAVLVPPRQLDQGPESYTAAGGGGGGGGAGTVTNTGALTVNQVVVGNAGVDVKILAAGSAGDVLTMVAGIPAWTAAAAGGTDVLQVQVFS